jgi:hypothetical protein
VKATGPSIHGKWARVRRDDDGRVVGLRGAALDDRGEFLVSAIDTDRAQARGDEQQPGDSSWMGGR